MVSEKDQHRLALFTTKRPNLAHSLLTQGTASVIHMCCAVEAGCVRIPRGLCN